MTEPPQPPAAHQISERLALELLHQGDLLVQGRMVDASNATLFGEISWAGATYQCIYKPERGERPLRDFPPQTLSRREVAAFLVSQATGWDVVPPTVWRDGPYGWGSAQLWIDHNQAAEPMVSLRAAAAPDPQWLTVIEGHNELGEPVELVHANDPRLARMAVFDAIIDNADRKAGHIIGSAEGHLWGVDHGLSFNVSPKLRTVLWGWQGQALPPECLDVLSALVIELGTDEPLQQELSKFLTEAEIAVTRARVQGLVRAGTFPVPTDAAPMVPWPLF